MPNAIITGTGSYIPTKKVDNSHFMENEFYDGQGNRIEKTNEEKLINFRK